MELSTDMSEADGDEGVSDVSAHTPETVGEGNIIGSELEMKFSWQEGAEEF